MRLADWMKKHGVDDEALGSVVKVDRVTISRIRRGVNRPSWDLIARLKKATRGAVTADDFLPTLKTPIERADVSDPPF